MVVVDLTQENMKEWYTTISGGKPSLVLFYADWCGHCQRFHPEWKKICTELSKHKGHINVAQVSHDNFQLLPNHLRVNGFPTIQIIRYGSVVETYMGNRSHEKVVEYALKFANPKPKRVQIKKKKPVLKDKKKKA